LAKICWAVATDGNGVACGMAGCSDTVGSAPPSEEFIAISNAAIAIPATAIRATIIDMAERVPIL
jgi:hypothetical protein